MFTRKIIYADGTELAIDGILSITEIADMLGAESLYILDLADNIHILLFDDEAYSRKFPVNKIANELFKQKHPMKDYVIRGDVVVIPSRDLDRETAVWIQ